MWRNGWSGSTKHLAKELEVQQLRNKIQSEVQDRCSSRSASTTCASR
jgi:hypothetical protein